MTLPPRHPSNSPAQVPTEQVHQPTAEIDSSTGYPVNAFSRAVLPSEQFPFHFNCLMNDLYQRGISPESWQVIAGDEVRLDEDGMDIEFSLLKVGTDHVWRRRINVQRGRLVSIVER